MVVITKEMKDALLALLAEHKQTEKGSEKPISIQKQDNKIALKKSKKDISDEVTKTEDSLASTSTNSSDLSELETEKVTKPLEEDTSNVKLSQSQKFFEIFQLKNTSQLIKILCFQYLLIKGCGMTIVPNNWDTKKEFTRGEFLLALVTNPNIFGKQASQLLKTWDSHLQQNDVDYEIILDTIMSLMLKNKNNQLTMMPSEFKPLRDFLQNKRDIVYRPEDFNIKKEIKPNPEVSNKNLIEEPSAEPAEKDANKKRPYISAEQKQKLAVDRRLKYQIRTQLDNIFIQFLKLTLNYIYNAAPVLKTTKGIHHEIGQLPQIEAIAKIMLTNYDDTQREEAKKLKKDGEKQTSENITESSQENSEEASLNDIQTNLEITPEQKQG